MHREPGHWPEATPLFVPGCKHVYSYCTAGHFNMGLYGELLAFAASHKQPFMKVHTWHFHMVFVFQPRRMLLGPSSLSQDPVVHVCAVTTIIFSKYECTILLSQDSFAGMSLGHHYKRRTLDQKDLVWPLVLFFVSSLPHSQYVVQAQTILHNTVTCLTGINLI